MGLLRLSTGGRHAVALMGLLAPLLAGASERFDHRGAVGLLLSGGGENRAAFALDGVSDNGWRGLLTVGGTYAFGVNESEWMLCARLGLGGPIVDGSVFGGFRGYYGYDRAKTFLELGLVANLVPVLAGGVRVGGGFQYELTPNVGLYTGAAVQLGIGAGVVFGVEVTGGIQLRTYWLEG